MRAAARQQIAGGREQGALEALLGGLALDPNDPVLNQMFADLTRTARDRATNARVNVARAGSAGATSPAFREAQQREREADRLLRGAIVPGITCPLSAAALYGKASERTRYRTPSVCGADPARALEHRRTSARRHRPRAVTPPAPSEPNRAPPTPSRRCAACRRRPPTGLSRPRRRENRSGDAAAVRLWRRSGKRFARYVQRVSKRWTARRSDE